MTNINITQWCHEKARQYIISRFEKAKGIKNYVFLIK